MKQYIDYYEKYKIIPTVDIGDLNNQTLIQQRESFYFLLGIHKNTFKNSSILELCTGNGHNAYHLLTSLNPSSITLVDNNEHSIRSLKKNLAKFKNKKINNKDIYKFNTETKFNFVIIENALPGLDDPNYIFNKSLSFLDKEGILITTLSDDFSLFSEKLRFLISHIVINTDKNKNLDRERKRELLSNIFKSHLKTLNTQTRSAEKWVEDNMLHYEWMSKEDYFSIEDIYRIYQRNKCFSILKTSPDFNTEFQWYKKFDRTEYMYNIFKNYSENKINFIDKRVKFKLNKTAEDRKILQNIYGRIKSINKAINSIKEDKIFPDKKINTVIGKLKALNKQFSLLDDVDHLNTSINELIIFLETYISKKEINLTVLKKFKGFWGNGTMQISIVKNS